MNPPIPGPPPLLSMPTITLLLGVTLFIQGTLIGLSARIIKNYKGVREAALATLALATSNLIVAISGPPAARTGYLLIYFAQLLSIGGYFLIYVAICRFIGVPSSRFIILGLAPLSFLSLTLAALLAAEPPPLKIVELITGWVVFAYTAWVLLSSDNQSYQLSARITSITLVGFSLAMLAHLIASFFSVDVVLPVGSTTEKIVALTQFVFSYLWTGGFILMVSQRLQSNLNDLALNDALTRVRNRRAMDQLLEFEMERVHQELRDFSIILLDIDNFKRINDNYGHDIGDQVLQWFASSLQGNLRTQDIIARWGGEEFLILLPMTNLDEAEQIAERLRLAVESTNASIANETINITFSAGISSSTTNSDVKSLCKVADQALYLAKQTRNQVLTQDKLTGKEVIYAI